MDNDDGRNELADLRSTDGMNGVRIQLEGDDILYQRLSRKVKCHGTITGSVEIDR